MKRGLLRTWRKSTEFLGVFINKSEYPFFWTGTRQNKTNFELLSLDSGHTGSEIPEKNIYDQSYQKISSYNFLNITF